MLKANQKNLLVKLIFLSLLTIFLSSCGPVKDTYLRKDLEKVVKDVCKQEFNLEVNTWERGETLWVYIPFNSILEKDNPANLDKDVQKQIGHLYHVIHRIILSMDKPPLFYCLVISDIKEIGVDLYWAGFIPDYVKVNMQFISLGEWQNKEYFDYFLNPRALGDKNGHHVKKYEMKIETFISKLIKQNLVKYFSSPEIRDYFRIQEINSDYQHGRLSLNFNITKENVKLPKGQPQLPNPWEKAVEIIRSLLIYYADIQKVNEIALNDIANNKYRIYETSTFLKMR